MNLVDENVGGAKSNKKLFIACGVGIVTLILVIVILLWENLMTLVII